MVVTCGKRTIEVAAVTNSNPEGVALLERLDNGLRQNEAKLHAQGTGFAIVNDVPVNRRSMAPLKPTVLFFVKLCILATQPRMETWWASCIAAYRGVPGRPHRVTDAGATVRGAAALEAGVRGQQPAKGAILAAMTWSLRHSVLTLCWSARATTPRRCGTWCPCARPRSGVARDGAQMMVSTKIHHALVVLCGGYLTLLPQIQRSLASCICVYAVCSSTAYAVNSLLALQHLVRDLTGECGGGATSGLLYAGACAVNWASQVRTIAQAPTRLWPMAPILAGFVYDDLVLLRLFCYVQ